MHALRASMGQATPPADDADEDDLVRDWQRSAGGCRSWHLFARLQLLGMFYHMHCMPMTPFFWGLLLSSGLAWIHDAV